jgi:hypothetical protein
MLISKRFPTLLAAIILLSLAACNKTPTDTLNEMVSQNGMIRYTGIFKGQGGQKVSGQAQIYLDSNKYVLKLSDFKSDNGPDLKVYLSKAESPSDHISLGNLKSTNGNQVYEISGTPDFVQYRYVLIHCEQFNHRYGSAELMK